MVFLKKGREDREGEGGKRKEERDEERKGGRKGRRKIQKCRNRQYTYFDNNKYDVVNGIREGMEGRGRGEEIEFRYSGYELRTMAEQFLVLNLETIASWL